MSRQARFHPPSAQLLTLLGGRVRPDDAPSHLLGVEHEYSLSDGEAPIDFRSIIHELTVGGERLDPGDANAYRLGSGIALTCDDAEAEIALPPVVLRPGFTREIERLNLTARSQLETLLPPRVTMRGYSTHVSAAMPPQLGDAACRLYATTFGPALMLLADRRDAHGMYLRPRPRRFEVCSEYIEGSRLGAVATFVAGSVRACASYLASGARESLPPAVEANLAPSDQRFGLYVSRRAFGGDLYESGRNAALTRLRGGTITAQEQLEAAWQAARASLVTSAAPEELRAVDLLVDSSARLPVETRLDERSVSLPDEPFASAFGSITQPRQRGALLVHATLATWDFTVFEVALAERPTYACVPREYLSSFLEALDSGRLDGLLISSLHRPAGNRVLESRAQTSQPGLWDRVGQPSDLLAPERTPEGVIVLRPEDATDRPGKSQAAIAVPRGRLFSVLFALLLVVLAFASVAMGYLLTRDDSPGSASAVVAETPTATPTATPSPSPTATAAATLTATPLPTATTVVVVVPSPTPTAPPIPPTATPVLPNQVAGVGPVAAVFNQPAQATTYTVLATGPGLTYSWTVSEACGSVAGATTNGFTWSHPHPPCDPTTNHAGALVEVIVTDPANNRVRCNYTGAANGIGPPCEPF